MKSSDYIQSVKAFLEAGTTTTLLTNANNLLKLILDVAAIICAVIGVSYIRNLHRKNLDATLSYLSQFRIRLQYIQYILEKNKFDIIAGLEQDGRAPAASRLEAVTNMRRRLSDSSADTLKFLRDTGNQYPAGKGWSARLARLIELLSVCENISITGYFLWTNQEDEKSKEDYYGGHLDNLGYMIKMIPESVKLRPVSHACAAILLAETKLSMKIAFSGKKVCKAPPSAPEGNRVAYSCRAYAAANRSQSC